MRPLTLRAIGHQGSQSEEADHGVGVGEAEGKELRETEPEPN